MIEQIINWFNALSIDGWFYVFCWIVFISFGISYLSVYGLDLKKNKK